MRFSDLGLNSYETLNTVEVQDLTESIDSFTTSADFFHWLIDGKFTEKVINEDNSVGQYSRIYQYYQDNVLLFTGKFNIFLDQTDPQLLKQVRSNPQILRKEEISLKNCSKKRLVQTIVEPFYNVISQCLHGEQVVGMCWEIYELSPLIRLYQKKEDPLRYWKSSRRE